MRRAAHSYQILLSAVMALSYVNHVQGAAADLAITPATLDFKYDAGSTLPAAQTLQIKSTGAALSFTISITGPLPYSAEWLSVSTLAGTTSASLNVYVNPTSLPGGSYTGSIVVSSALAATPVHTIPITLEVGNAPSTISASTNSLTFNYITGNAAPASQPVEVLTSGNALTVSITITGGTWLQASPSGSISLVGLPGTVNVSINPGILLPGAYSGQIVFASATAANKSVVVAVVLNVAAAPPSIAAVWPPGALTGSAASVVTLTGANFFATSVVTIGTTVLTKTLVGANTILATIPASLLTLAGPLSITITTPTASSASAPAIFTVYGPGPQLWAVANGASANVSTVSPGGIVTVYGVGLGPTALTVFPGTNPVPVSLPATAPSTSITLTDLAGTVFNAPILYTSATQVSCIVPFGLAVDSGAAVTLVLTYNGLTSLPFSVNVFNTDPGIFTLDASGIGAGAILNYNSTTGNYTVNTATNAATAGSTVVIYATGFGPITCISTASSTCAASPSEAQLVTGTVTPTATVAVTIGGQAALVQAAQAPIGSVAGLLQINVTVPVGIAPSSLVPVLVTFGTANSQTGVTMTLK
jgi:uncharacterized protein (TIGR03437 family)